MIDTIPFGRTGHQSTRIIFGAAAIGGMHQDRADGVLDLIRAHGINHIDTAAAYGESELRLAPLLADHRDEFFLATKTRERTARGARAELERSLTRLGVDSVDLIQLHNLTDAAGWETAMGPGGAVEGLDAARSEGLVGHVGVTGHGTLAPSMHLRSLEAYPFASVLVPYNFTMLAQADYAADLEALLGYCREHEVAVQTIKAVAHRRWRAGDTDRRFSWYRPIREPDALRRAVHYVLARPGLFLNTTSDATLLPAVMAAASEVVEPPDGSIMAADARRLGVEPLFVRGVSEDVG